MSQSTLALPLVIVARNVLVASLRTADIDKYSHWLVQKLLFPAPSEQFFVLTDTDHEMTLLMEASSVGNVPVGVKFSGERYVAIRVCQGDLGFELAGVVNAIAAPLAAAKVPLLYISNYATDVVLIGESRLADAQTALRAAGFTFKENCNDQSVDSERGGGGEAVASKPKVHAKVKKSDESSVVLTQLPFDVRMSRIKGKEWRRLACGLVRICLYAERADRFFSLTRLHGNEISLFGEARELKECFGDADVEEMFQVSDIEWTCMLMSTRDFGIEESGVMARFTQPLAEEDISIFKVTTMSNDYSLVRTEQVACAVEKMRRSFENVELIVEELQEE